MATPAHQMPQVLQGDAITNMWHGGIFGIPWPAVFTLLCIMGPMVSRVFFKGMLWFIKFVTREIIKEANTNFMKPLQGLEDTLLTLAARVGSVENSGEQLVTMLQDLDAGIAGWASRFESFGPIEDVKKQFLGPLQTIDEAITALATRFDPLENLHASVMSVLSTSTPGAPQQLIDDISKVLDKLATAQTVQEMTASKVHDMVAGLAALEKSMPNKVKELWEELQPLLEKWAKDVLPHDSSGSTTSGDVIGRIDSVNANFVAKIESVLGFSRDAHAMLVRLKDKSEELTKETNNAKSAVLAAVKDVVPMVRHGRDLAKSASEYAEKSLHALGNSTEQEIHHMLEEAERNIRYISGQEEDVLAHTRKVESMCTGLIDQLSDVASQVERQGETIASRLKILQELQGTMDRMMGQVANIAATRTMPAPPMAPPTFVSHGPGHDAPPPPQHTPNVFPGARDPASTPVILTDARGLLNALSRGG